MDPITLATVTSAVTMLATEAAKEVAGGVGKSLWDAVKAKLGWTVEPPAAELAPRIAQQLENNEALANEIVRLLQAQAQQETAITQQLVGQLDASQAGKVVNIPIQTAARDIHNTFNL